MTVNVLYKGPEGGKMGTAFVPGIRIYLAYAANCARNTCSSQNSAVIPRGHNNTIIPIFCKANKNKDVANVVLASSNS